MLHLDAIIAAYEVPAAGLAYRMNNGLPARAKEPFRTHVCHWRSPARPNEGPARSGSLHADHGRFRTYQLNSPGRLQTAEALSRRHRCQERRRSSKVRRRG